MLDHVRPLIFLASILLGCSGLSRAGEIAVHLANASGTPLAEAVVFVSSNLPVALPTNRKSVIIRQKNRVFDPFVTVIANGTAVDFPNEDSMLHHIYSFSPAKRFQVKLYRETPPEPVVFEKAGIVALGCNLHDWMLAYVVVVDTPFFAKSTSDGIARIAGLPRGTHDLMVWAPGMSQPARMRQISIPADEKLPIEHKFDISIKARPKAPPLDPMRY